MPGNVHGGDLLVEHLRPALGQTVDRVVHAKLVPRHRLRGQDHRVAPVDPHGRMVVVRDSRQGRHRLALAARAENHRLARRELLELPRPDERVVGRLEVAEIPRDVEVLPHRAADDADLASGLDGDVDGLLHPVDVRGEARHEHAPLPRRDDLAERLADEALGAGESWALRVRRVTQHQVDATIPDVRETADIGAQPVDRRVIELVVAGVEDPQAAGLEHDRDRVRDRVRHADELRPEGADLDGAVLGFRLAQLGRLREAVLVELRLEQAERETRAPHLGHLDRAHQVRQRADVVLVRMREDHGSHPVGPLLQVSEVGQDEIDAEMLVARKGEARVDDDDLAVRLVDGQVLADLAQASERRDSHLVKCPF